MECKWVSTGNGGKFDLRINRYIMECKFRKTGSYQKQLSELIDTLWNVNK